MTLFTAFTRPLLGGVLLVAAMTGCSASTDKCASAAAAWQEAQEATLDVIDEVMTLDRDTTRAAVREMEDLVDEAFEASVGCDSVDQ